ncbi:Uncharacterized protein APZ42_029132 [Daphnia magna]|uniref:Secreted protein n=1 Tax=Daphnia magna TaxID=35525 RepID=A0A164PWT8_9CRUS|nr:Uncharacterized protein APZ42_029132 [Daphnia magna]
MLCVCIVFHVYIQPNPISIMPTLVTLLLLLFSTNAFQITTCNCNKSSGVGLLQFSDGSCEPATRTVSCTKIRTPI